MIALDTNVVIDLMRGHPVVRENHFKALGRGEHFHLSCLVLEEMTYAVARHSTPARQADLFRHVTRGMGVTPFEPPDARRAGEVRAELRRRGTPAPYADLLIGAHAAARGHVLVTANTRHFQNIPGLQLLDWTQPPADAEDSHA